MGAEKNFYIEISGNGPLINSGDEDWKINDNNYSKIRNKAKERSIENFKNKRYFLRIKSINNLLIKKSY